MKKAPFLFFLFSFLALGALQENFVSSALAAHGAKKSEGGKEEKGEKKKKKEDTITGGRFDGDPVYVHIAPMVLPIISNDGIEQLVSLIVSVHVKDLDTANTLHKNMPRVVDSLLRHLYGGLDEGTLKKGKLVNLDRIKTTAKTAVGEIIGTENIREVLVEGIAQRML